MKKIITILSAMLIVAGLKAQKTTVQKETVKPMADSMLKKNAAVNNNAATPALKKTHKGAEMAPVIKYAPAMKKSKKATLEQ